MLPRASEDSIYAILKGLGFHPNLSTEPIDPDPSMTRLDTGCRLQIAVI